jgi:hypothetical protein
VNNGGGGDGAHALALGVPLELGGEVHGLADYGVFKPRGVADEEPNVLGDLAAVVGL